MFVSYRCLALYLITVLQPQLSERSTPATGPRSILKGADNTKTRATQMVVMMLTAGKEFIRTVPW